MSAESQTDDTMPTGEQKELSKLEKDYQGLRASLDRIFAAHADPESRLKELQVDTIQPEKFKMAGVDPEQFKSELARAVALDTPDAFREAMFELGKPFIDARHADPQAYEALERERFLQKENFTPVNQLLAYGVSGTHMHLHVQPNETASLREKLRFIKEGLAEIAKVLQAHPEIETVGGTSWIVGEHEGILKHLGFRVSELNEEQKKFYAYEERKVADATMNRDEFLKKYLDSQ